MGFEQKGVVCHIGPIEEIGEKGFRKSIIVIDTGGEYPQQIPFEMTGEKADLSNDVAVGEYITMHFNLRGNEYNGRYYVNLRGWKIDKATVGGAPTPPPPADPLAEEPKAPAPKKAPAKAAKKKEAPAPAPVEEDDDLPF